MRQFVLFVALAAISAGVVAQDQWDIYTEKGWKGTIYVDVKRDNRVQGWFVKRNGTRCDILTSPRQFFEGDVRGDNFEGDIATTCGIWSVWKAKYAIPSVKGTTGTKSQPFGKLFTGKVVLD